MIINYTIATAEGGTLNVRIDGAEGAPWIVLSNSVLTDLSIWDGQVADLTDRWRVLRYDQRGHGRSSVPNGPMSFAHYGDDLVTLLGAFGIDRCVFVGLSMGVPTGLAALMKRPECFAAFIAVDGIARSAAGREAFWAERREIATSSGMSAIADTTVPRWLPGEPADGPLAERLSTMVAQTPADGFAAATHALANYDLSAALNTFPCRFLGIAGEHDGAMPGAMRAQFGALPNANFVDVPACGHLPNYQSPVAFNEALRGFLKTIAPSLLKETH